MIKRDMKQINKILFLMVVIITIVSVTALDIKKDIRELSDDLKGVYNNEKFSNSIETISESVYLIIKQPINPEDSINMGDIYLDKEGNMWKKGTGFAVNKNGWLITAKHVVDDATQVFVLEYDSEGNEKRFPAEHIGLDVEHDLGIIKINKTTTPVKIIEVNDILPQGFKIGFMGFPSDDPTAKISHDGIISYSRLRGSEGHELPEYNIHAFVNGGHSGGPVFLADSGDVIGIISARAKAFNLPSAEYIDPAQFSNDDIRKMLANIYNRQSEMYNILKREVSEKTQMGVGVVVGFNKAIIDQILELSKEDFEDVKKACQ